MAIFTFTPYPSTKNDPAVTGYFNQYDNTPEGVLLGRGQGQGLGRLQRIELGDGLELAGATLKVSGGITAGPFVVALDGGGTLTIQVVNGVVTVLA